MRDISKALLPVLPTAGFAVATHAQDAGDYPNRPIRIAVPVRAGAGTDMAARLTAAAAEPHLDQEFVPAHPSWPGSALRPAASMPAMARSNEA